jgi:CRISPR/Cas system-associated protein Csm6
MIDNTTKYQYPVVTTKVLRNLADTKSVAEWFMKTGVSCQVLQVMDGFIVCRECLDTDKLNERITKMIKKDIDKGLLDGRLIYFYDAVNKKVKKIQNPV